MKKLKRISSLIMSMVLALFMLSSTAFAADVQVDPSVAEVLDVDADVEVQVTSEDELNSDEFVSSEVEEVQDVYLTEDDLQKTNVSAPTAGTLVGNAFSDASTLNAANELTFANPNGSMSRSNSNRAAAAASDGFYTSIADTITTEGDYRFVYPIILSPGELLHVQLDSPNSASIDYNLYLYEVDANANMTMIDLSEYPTYINGTNGTIPEAVGAVNTGTEEKQYAAFVESYIGASINQAFILHIGINNVADSFEVDESEFYASAISLESNNNTVINLRQRDTLADNDWYKFTVPANAGYDSLTVDIDEGALAVYTKAADGAMVLQATEGAEFDVAQGTYYLRAYTAGILTSLTNTDYTITIPNPTTSNPPGGGTPGGNSNVTDITITSLSGGTYVTYNEGRYYRVNTNNNLTVNGIAQDGSSPAANASITVTFEDFDSYSSKTATTTTDSNGNFSVQVKAPDAYGDRECMVMEDPDIYHYYDMGGVFASNGAVNSNAVGVYIYSYSYYG